LIFFLIENHLIWFVVHLNIMFCII